MAELFKSAGDGLYYPITDKDLVKKYITHIGMAKPGSGTDEKAWVIKKFVLNASNEITDTQFAGGDSTSHDKIMDNYATYNYS